LLKNAIDMTNTDLALDGELLAVVAVVILTDVLGNDFF